MFNKNTNPNAAIKSENSSTFWDCLVKTQILDANISFQPRKCDETIKLVFWASYRAVRCIPEEKSGDAASITDANSAKN